MSGFAGGGGGGGPFPPGVYCATYLVDGTVEMATLGEVDARTAIGGSGCPLAIGPPNLRLHIGVGQCVFLDPPAGGLNMPGALAMDWQSTHAAPTQVAYGALSSAFGASNTILANSPQATAIGYNNTIGYGGMMPIASPYSVALGRRNVVRGTNSIAIGSASDAWSANTVAIGSTARALNQDGIAIGRLSVVGAGGLRSIAIGQGSGTNGDDSVALGALAQSTGNFAHAFGAGAVARQTRTTNITSPIVTRRDNGEVLANADLYFSGANILIMFPEVDYNVVAEYDLTLFGGVGLAHIWLEEVGVILTTLGAPVTVQPTVRFGNVAIRNKYMGPTLCTLLNALRARDRFILMQMDDPEVALNFGITVAGTPGPATNYVRPYFRGHIIEDE